VTKAKKSLGQNFLTDQVIMSRILETVNPKEEDEFFEIGAGKGALTKNLIPTVKNIEIVEIDKDLIPDLKKLELSSNKIKVHEGSVLKMELEKLSRGECKFRVIGNLPYNLSSKIMLWSFQNVPYILDMHYMFQKEFGERLVSAPGKKTYGRLSVLSQYMFESLDLFEISPESFRPKPSVKSIFIKFTPKPKRDVNSLEAIKLQEITQLMFSKRRKKISTSCKSLVSANDFIDLDINPDDRPESLSVKEFLKICKYLLHNTNG
jgi:16S rRNA (adenine1518-N6/adenine1519-N6)-dimethyltransferase